MNHLLSYLHVPNLLTKEMVQELKAKLDQVNFIDGKTTASLAAKEVKNNLQADFGSLHDLSEPQQIVMDAIYRNTLVQAAVMPKNIYPPLFSKYHKGMSYGWHVDSPLMGQPAIRTDVACTIFLNDPSTYEGGELIVASPSGNVSYKLQVGDAIFYPAERLHGVSEVISGERYVAVSWIQSAIQSADKREILFNMNQVHSSIIQRDLHAPEGAVLLQSYSNLLKMWVEN